MEQDNYKDLALIEQYLNGELEGESLVAFEKRRTDDAGFAKEVEVMRSMLEGVQMKGEENMKDMLAGVESKLEKEDFFPKPESKVIKMEPKKKFNWIGVAAAIAALVVAFIWFNQDTAPSPEEAYAKFYKKETKVLNQTLDDLEVFGIGDPEKDRKDQLVTALKLYEGDNYQAAVDGFNNYLATHSPDPTASYYLGHTYMNLSEYGRAIEILSPLIKLTDFELLDWSKYYLALSYSMLDTTEGNLNAVTLMNQLKTSKDEEIAQLANGWLEFSNAD